MSFRMRNWVNNKSKKMAWVRMFSHVKMSSCSTHTKPFKDIPITRFLPSTCNAYRRRKTRIISTIVTIIYLIMPSKITIIWIHRSPLTRSRFHAQFFAYRISKYFDITSAVVFRMAHQAVAIPLKLIANDHNFFSSFFVIFMGWNKKYCAPSCLR